MYSGFRKYDTLLAICTKVIGRKKAQNENKYSTIFVQSVICSV